MKSNNLCICPSPVYMVCRILSCTWFHAIYDNTVEHQPGLLQPFPILDNPVGEFVIQAMIPPKQADLEIASK